MRGLGNDRQRALLKHFVDHLVGDLRRKNVGCGPPHDERCARDFSECVPFSLDEGFLRRQSGLVSGSLGTQLGIHFELEQPVLSPTQAEFRHTLQCVGLTGGVVQREYGCVFLNICEHGRAASGHLAPTASRAAGTDVIIKGRGGADLGGGNPGNPGGDGPRGGGTGGGSANTGNPGGGAGEGGNPGGGHVARSDLSQDTAGGWMAVIWAAVTDSMNTWVGAVWLLVMWAVVWVTVSTLRISFTRTKKRPSRSAAAMARGRIRQPV